MANAEEMADSGAADSFAGIEDGQQPMDDVEKVQLERSAGFSFLMPSFLVTSIQYIGSIQETSTSYRRILSQKHLSFLFATCRLMPGRWYVIANNPPPFGRNIHGMVYDFMWTDEPARRIRCIIFGI